MGEDELVEVDTDGDILDVVDLLLGQVQVLELLEIDSCSLGRDDGGGQLHGGQIVILWVWIGLFYLFGFVMGGWVGKQGGDRGERDKGRQRQPVEDMEQLSERGREEGRGLCVFKEKKRKI